MEEDGEEGEIHVKGPCMMLGYLDNPGATASTIDSDGWLRTGDIGYCRQGLWYIIDRKKVNGFTRELHHFTPYHLTSELTRFVYCRI